MGRQSTTPSPPDRPRHQDTSRSRGILETIPEGEDSEEEDEQEGPVNQLSDEEIYLEVERQILEEADCEKHSLFNLDVDDPPLHYYDVVEDEVWNEAFPQEFNYQALVEEAEDLRVQTPTPETEHTSEQPIMEYYYTSDASKLNWRTEQENPVPEEDEQLKVHIKPDGSSKLSIEKNKQILTPEEVKEYWPDVLKNIYKELSVWAHNGCISHKPKKDAENIVDCKFVITWTW